MAINILMFEIKDAEKEYFAENKIEGCNITFYEECLDMNFIKTLPNEVLENTHAISIFNNSSVTREVLENFKNLRVISIRAAIFDHICLESCEDKNIAVVNIPEFGAQSVAEYTIGLIINLVRNIVPANNLIKSGKKYTGGFLGRDLGNLTLGVVGTGITGAIICKLAKAFGMKIIAYDNIIRQELIEKYEIEYVNIEELAHRADIVSAQIEYTPETYHLFNEEFFSNCKEGLYFINTSKSEIIDLEALTKSLDSGKIGKIALDTSPCESICYNCKNLSTELYPSSLECLNQTEFIDKFVKYENVIITPCISYATKDAIIKNLSQTIINIKKALKGDRMCRIV